MPIDPSIPLSVKSPELPSPLEVYSTVAQLQAQREAAELRREAAEEARQRRVDAQEERAAKKAEQQQLDQLYASSVTTDPETGHVTLDYDKLLKGAPGHLVPTLRQQFAKDVEAQNTLIESSFKLDKSRREWLGAEAQDVLAAQGDPELWRTVVLRAEHAKAITKDTAEQLRRVTDPKDILARAQAWMQAAGGKPTGLEKIETVNAQGQPVTQFVTPTAGASYPMAPPKPAQAASVGSFEDYVARDAAQRNKPITSYTTADIDKLREKFRLDQRPSITVNAGGGSPDDVKQIVQGMMDGTLPPQLPGRASPLYNAILAEAKRRGFNLAGAVTDWMATTKHVQTMNGAQQLRLTQAVNALPEMLDNVETLATKWNAGSFPALNKAHLALAKGGAYGTEAAKIANQLDAQIADVVADLGNVYMGGNSPTDHALQLAGKSLSADWSEPVLRAMVALAKKNVQIRRNSINSTGVAGASEDNPYAQPTPTTPSPTLRFNPATGKVEPIK